MFSYKSKRWQQKRAVILKRDGYLCQWAKRSGRTEGADTVHHIFPVEDYPQYALCDWNLISLSSASHNLMHDRNTRELTEEGMIMMRETAARQGIDIGDDGVTLITGMPGTGKTDLAKRIMKSNALAYDLDAIAGAFRLGKSETQAARWMANDLLGGFVMKAGEYAGHVVVIRTAPRIQELEQIRPDRIYLLTKIHVDRGIEVKDFDRRIEMMRMWSDDNCVPLIVDPPTYSV